MDCPYYGPMTSEVLCPCGQTMSSYRARGALAHRCDRCGCVFISHSEFREWTARLRRSYTLVDLRELRERCRERMGALLRVSLGIAEPAYPPCPICRTPMVKRSFAGGSGIPVYDCRSHGQLGAFNWLQQVLDFVTNGGEYLVVERELRCARESEGRHDRGSIWL